MNKKLDKEYTVGLDIGVANNGFVAIDDDFNIIKHGHRHEIGVTEFKKAQTAESTRILRGSRRRYRHQKWRLKQLKDYFMPHFIDLMGEEETEEYFKGFKDSWVSNDDDLRKGRRKNFNSEIKEFPTRYHAALALINNDSQVPTDPKKRLKLIYEVIHPMVKYRGNFLRKEKVDDLDLGELDIDSSLTRINLLLKNIKTSDESATYTINTENSTEIRGILLSKEYTRSNRKQKLTKCLETTDSDKAVVEVIATFLVGDEVKRVKIEKVFGVDASSILNSKGNPVSSFSLNPKKDGNLDNISKLTELLSSSGKEILDELKTIYNQVTLHDLIPLGKSYSEAMVESYDKFHKQLVLLKAVMKRLDSEDKIKLEEKLDDYLNFKHRGSKKSSAADFQKAVIDTLEPKSKDKDKKKQKEKYQDDPDIQKLVFLADNELLLLPQRNYKNGTIPHQVHQLELRRIIATQSQIPGFEWLADNDLISPKRDEKYNLERFIDFRIPYFVGPLTTNEHSRFAWLVYNENVKRETLTVWNFEKQIDYDKTIENFITRMTATDTYLLGEPVLPAKSLTYQKYEVLNELNNTRISKRPLSVEEKQAIFNDLFMKQKAVTTEQVANVLRCRFNRSVKTSDITGPSNGVDYNSSLSTYLTLKKIKGIDDSLLTSKKYASDWDKLTKYLTIFEKNDVVRKEARIKKLKLAQVENFPVKEIASLSLDGWGRLSSLLLNGIYIGNRSRKESIMDLLWRTKSNFQQIITKEECQKQISNYNQKYNDLPSKNQKINSVLKLSRISPENERSIRVCINIIEDLVRFNGREPKLIALEFARGSHKVNNAPKYSRIKKLIEEQITTSEWKDTLQNEFKRFKTPKDFGIKEYLYFSQNCKDIYDPSHTINLDELDRYEIDHIYPRSINGKDDSLDNLVLTQSKNNQKKGNLPAVKVFSNKAVSSYWTKLKDNGFISEDKYNNLNRDWIDNATNQFKIRMLKRSLVQSSSIIKVTAQILTMLYPNTKIVAINASLSHRLRSTFNLFKVRNVNDFHHAVDAYLAAFEAQFLWKLYPKLRPLIDYNDYQKLDSAALKDVDLQKFAFLALTDENHHLVHGDMIVNSDGEIVGRKSKLIKRLTNLRNPDNIRIVKMPTKAEGGLFNSTINHHSKNPKKAVPRKKNMSPEVYGFYSGTVTSKIVLIKTVKQTKDGKSNQYSLDKLTNLSKSDEENAISKLVDARLNSKTTLDKVITLPINTLFERKVPVTWEDGEGHQHQKLTTERILLSSDEEYHNFNGFTLSDNAMSFLQTFNSNESDKVIAKKLIEMQNEYRGYKDANDALNQIFDEILLKCKLELPLISQGHKPFESLSSAKAIKAFHDYSSDLSKKLQDIESILLAVSDTSRLELSSLNSVKGLKGTLGRFNRGIKSHLMDDTVLVFRSATGLFERKIAFKDLQI